MSRPVKEMISCSECGHSQEFTYWSSVNSSLDPKLKEYLLQGKLTTFICDHCGTEVHVAYDLLYHDMDSSLMIWLKYPDESGKVYLNDAVDEMFNLMGENYIYRIVPSFQELVEKIKIFDDGLDDFTIELLKLMVCMSAGIDIVDPLYYDRTEKSLRVGRSIVLVHIVGNELIERHYSVKKQLSKVNAVREKLMSLVPQEEKRWVYINREYVLRRLELSGLMSSIA